MLEAEERDTLAVDRDIYILEPRPLAKQGLDREHVLPVHRKIVSHHHPAPRPVWSALEMIPGMLRDVDGVRVLGGTGPGVRVPDGEPAHLGGRPQVGFEQGGRKPLSVGHVVERAQVGVRREPAARVDLEIEEIADHALVLGAVQPLEAPGAGVRIPRGRAIDQRLERFHQRQQRIRRRPPLAGRRHHPRAELADHLLRGRRALVRRIDVERLQDEVPAQQPVIVAAGAVALDHSGQIRRVGEGSHVVLREGCRGSRTGRTVPRGLPHEGEPQPQNRTRTQCLHTPVLQRRQITVPRNR